jgi:hypothetical protein
VCGKDSVRVTNNFKQEKEFMLSSTLKITSGLLLGGVVLVGTGCCSSAKGDCYVKTTPKEPCETKVVAYVPPPPPPHEPCERGAGELTALPPNAKSGECYAKVFVPATYRTVTERVLVRDASETIEIVPARYEWVEERTLVKDASTELAVVPAEFAPHEETIQTADAHTDWEINKNANCVNPKEQPARDVFCLVDHAAVRSTHTSQRQVKAASVRQVEIPAEYQTVRRQKLASAATTRRVSTPAEFSTVEKRVKICDGRMAWQRVICDEPNTTAVTMNDMNEKNSDSE